MHSSTSFKGCIFHSTSHFFHEVMHIYGDEAVLSTCNALKGALFTFGFKAPGSVVLLAAVPLPFHAWQSFISCGAVAVFSWPRYCWAALLLALSSGYSCVFRRDPPSGRCALVSNPFSTSEVVNPPYGCDLLSFGISAFQGLCVTSVLP